jgi:YEATS domain-containing protein 4
MQTISIPLTYGCVSSRLKEIKDGHTHEWTVYLRVLTTTTAAHLIERVVIILHESFLNPKRVFTKEPYEVTETGWGEFQIQFKVFFKQELKEKSITLTHPLRLFGDMEKQQNDDEKLVTEKYDEIILCVDSTTTAATVAVTDQQVSPSSSSVVVSVAEREERVLDELNTLLNVIRQEKMKLQSTKKRKYLQESNSSLSLLLLQEEGGGEGEELEDDRSKIRKLE